MRLLENVYHDRVSADTVATVMSFGKKIGKVSVDGNKVCEKFRDQVKMAAG